MSMRPIDLQSIMAQTKEVEKLHQAAHSRQQNHLATFEEEEAERARQAGERVRDPDKAAETRIGEKRENPDSRRRRPKKKVPRLKETDAEAEIYDPLAGLHNMGPAPSRDVKL